MSQGTSPIQAVRLRDGRQTREAILHAATLTKDITVMERCVEELKRYLTLYEVAST